MTIFWYLAILFDSLLNINKLAKYRKLTITKYPKNFNFEEVFSNYFYHTRKDLIPISGFKDTLNYLRVAIKDLGRFFKPHSNI